MVTDLKIDIPEREIGEFCRRWKITELAFFGSVLATTSGPTAMWTCS